MQHNSLSIFPNPASEVVHIKTDVQNTTGYLITINDVLGRLVYSGRIQANTTEAYINVTAFAKGLYYVRMTGDDGYRTVQKLLID